MPMTKEERELKNFQMKYFTRKNLRNTVKQYDRRVVEEYIKDARQIISAYKDLIKVLGVPMKASPKKNGKNGKNGNKNNNNTPFHTPAQTPRKRTPKAGALKPPPPPPPPPLLKMGPKRNIKNNRPSNNGGGRPYLNELKKKIATRKNLNNAK